MNVLVTGGAGFIGSHVCDALLEQGHRVTALDNLSTGRHENIEPFHSWSDFEFVLGSILNADLMDDLAARADVIYHLAAAVGVDLIVQRPLESLATNIRGSEVVLEKAHKYACKGVVTSTSEIHGKNTSYGLREDDDLILGSPLKSRWSYWEAKAIDETLPYYKEKALDTVIVRLFNTVGPRQTGSYGIVIPRFVTQAVRNEPVTVYGDGSQDALLLLRRFGAHLVDGARRRVRKGLQSWWYERDLYKELAHKVIDLAGSTSLVRHQSFEEAYEEGFEDMQRRVPDITRVQELIGFSPSVDLDETIRKVIAEQPG